VNVKRTLTGLAFATAAIAAPIPYLVADDKPAAGIFNDKPDAEGFVSIFNGKDLTGWAGQDGYWDVKDGAISGHETKDKSRQTFLVFNQPVSNFELRYKFKFNAPPGADGKVEGNSGVQFRSKVLDPKKDPYRVGGYQADCDAGNGFTGIIYDEAGVAGGRGIMSKRGEKTHYAADGDLKKPHTEKLPMSDAGIKNAIKVGDWNDCVLIADGNHITYQINGVTTTELIDDSPKALKEGVLALQVHQGFTMDILFKDMKMKKLGQ
jgi:hypothetical protein